MVVVVVVVVVVTLVMVIITDGVGGSLDLLVPREAQDEYGMESYKRAAAAYDSGAIGIHGSPTLPTYPGSPHPPGPEIVPVEIKGKRGKPSTLVTEDEEFRKVNFDKFAKLPTVFQREGGSVTAGRWITCSWALRHLPPLATTCHLTPPATPPSPQVTPPPCRTARRRVS